MSISTSTITHTNRLEWFRILAGWRISFRWRRNEDALLWCFTMENPPRSSVS
ncbi:hypothetical protein [Capnocytophaga gingivalis]|uniref:hypothetical protein n=1 Tax=Capnocytophaga gingivalis TaxID=1017 RepID=UPI0028EC1EC6|nr:hypothetical protein [Capnocytophaga gingivalis]